MKIRAATHTDATAIRDIWNPIIKDSLATFTTRLKTEPDITQMLDDKARHNHPFVIAHQNDHILGFATYGQFRAGPGYAQTMEHTIILSPTARGKGTGRSLMQAIENHAKARKIHSLIAGVSGVNAPAIAFHKSCGYTEIAQLPQVGFKFDRRLDLVLLQKLL